MCEKFKGTEKNHIHKTRSRKSKVLLLWSPVNRTFLLNYIHSARWPFSRTCSTCVLIRTGRQLNLFYASHYQLIPLYSILLPDQQPQSAQVLARLPLPLSTNQPKLTQEAAAPQQRETSNFGSEIFSPSSSSTIQSWLACRLPRRSYNISTGYTHTHIHEPSKPCVQF